MFYLPSYRPELNPEDTVNADIKQVENEDRASAGQVNNVNTD